LAKQQIGPLPTAPSRCIALLLIDGDWRQAPRHQDSAGRRLLPARGGTGTPAPYVKVCEHCPGFRADLSHLAVLAAQRVDATAANSLIMSLESADDRH
jgi:hypothetical protein